MMEPRTGAELRCAIDGSLAFATGAALEDVAARVSEIISEGMPGFHDSRIIQFKEQQALKKLV